MGHGVGVINRFGELKISSLGTASMIPCAYCPYSHNWSRAGQGVLIGFLSQSPPATRLNYYSPLKHLKWHGDRGIGCY